MNYFYRHCIRAPVAMKGTHDVRDPSHQPKKAMHNLGQFYGEATWRLMSCREMQEQNWASKGSEQSQLTSLFWQHGAQIKTTVLTDQMKADKQKSFMRRRLLVRHTHHTHTSWERKCAFDDRSAAWKLESMRLTVSRHAHNYIINTIFCSTRESF